MPETLVSLVLIVTSILLIGIVLSTLFAARPARAHFALAMFLAATIVAPLCWLSFGAIGLGVADIGQGAQLDQLESRAAVLTDNLQAISITTAPQPASMDSSNSAAADEEPAAIFGADSIVNRPSGASITTPSPTVARDLQHVPVVNLGSAFVVFWLFLSSLMLALVFRSLLITRRLIHRALDVDCDTLSRSFSAAVEEMQILRAPRLAHSDRISCPVICCWGTPKVIVPTQMLTEADDTTDWQGIFRHELAHLRRRDHLATLLTEIIRVLIPWHPLSYVAARRLHALSERACDDWVSNYAANVVESERYAETLLSLHAQRLGLGVQAALGSRSHLAKRIRRIVSPARSDPRVGKAWGVALSLLAIMTIIGTGVAQEGKPGASEDAIETSEQESANDAAASKRDDFEPVPLSRSEAPQLIAVWPADNAQDVDPETELHLRFDRPIDPRSFELQWIEGSYFEIRPTRYLGDKNELVIPIRLTPGRLHRISINNELGSGLQRIKGFLGADGAMVESAEWQFTTKEAPTPKNDRRPNVVSIHPPERSKIARATLVRVRFDQPMDSSAYDAIRGSIVDETPIDIGIPHFISDNHEVVFPVVLPPDWSGQIELSGMKSIGGSAAEPITISYSSSEEVFDKENLNQFSDPESSATLRSVLENVRRSRAKLQSFSATVRSTRVWGGRRARGQGFSRLDRNWTQFKMQGANQYYSDVTQVMGIPFRIGSDGEQCWFFSHRDDDEGQRRPTLIACEPAQIANQYLAFADPFDLQNQDTDQIVNDRNLQYVGIDAMDGRDCHLIGSWNPAPFGGDRIMFSVKHWWIDAETYLPIQVVGDAFGSRTQNRFQYASVNEPIPLSEFQPSVTDKTVRRGPDPLGDGYESRYLKISDGTNGRMSCRWGMSGTKGTSSSGLN